MVHSEFGAFLKDFTASSNTTTAYLCADTAVFSTAKRKILDDHVGSDLRNTGIKLIDLIHKLRWRKSPAEQDLMRKTTLIGCEALTETMRFAAGGMLERVLAGKMDFESKIRGAQGLAYPPVIAGGERANIIHYIIANQVRRSSCLESSIGAILHRNLWPVLCKVCIK